MKEKSSLYGRKLLISAGYAAAGTACLFRAPHGITYPLFAAAMLVLFFLVLRLQGETWKRSAFGFAAGIMILSVHVATTGNAHLIAIDKGLMYLLLFMLILHSLYDDTKWDVMRYLGAVTDFILTSCTHIFDCITDGIEVFRGRGEPDGTEGTEGADCDTRKKESPVKYIFLGLMIAVVLLCVIVPLLMSSDAVFAKVLNDLWDLKIDETIMLIGVLFGVLFVASYALISTCSKKIKKLLSNAKDTRTVDPAVAITFTSVIMMVYVLYCAIQIYYLFLGAGSLPDGYTYAKYAHEGFYELVAVCLINLVMVLLCRKYSKSSFALPVILTAVCGCTYIMLGSSLYRMILYIEAYGFTFLRAFVLFALAAIALVMAAAVTLVFRPSFPFVKCALAAVVMTWVVFAFSYPDRWIADYNLKHNYGIEYTVFELSTDAVPVITRQWGGDKWGKDVEKLFRKEFEEAAKKKDFRNFNLSEYYARRALEQFH